MRGCPGRVTTPIVRAKHQGCCWRMQQPAKSSSRTVSKSAQKSSGCRSIGIKFKEQYFCCRFFVQQLATNRVLLGSLISASGLGEKSRGEVNCWRNFDLQTSASFKTNHSNSNEFSFQHQSTKRRVGRSIRWPDYLLYKRMSDKDTTACLSTVSVQVMTLTVAKEIRGWNATPTPTKGKTSKQRFGEQLKTQKEIKQQQKSDCCCCCFDVKNVWW